MQLRIPEASAAKATKNKYGKITRFSEIAWPHETLFPEFAVNAWITAGENTIPNTVISATINASVQKSRFAKSQTSSFGFSRRYVVKTGMKDAVIDPSATRRRKRFGIRYAKTKELAARDVPRRNVMRWSRT